MSAIQVHTADPVSPAKASAVTPQTRYAPAPTHRPQPSATVTATRHNDYSLARPGQSVPTPTKTQAPAPASREPPPPQPGASSNSLPPSTTARATLPPPPKAGEKLLPSQHYNPAATPPPSLPQPYPPQMAQPSLFTPAAGIPPASTTSTFTDPFFDPSAQPTPIRHPSPGTRSRASIEHPTGYVQNQYATEMTAEARFAQLQQEQQNSSKPPEPVLGYVPQTSRSRAGSTASNTVAAGGELWQGVKGWMGGFGDRVAQGEGKAWDWLNGKK